MTRGIVMRTLVLLGLVMLPGSALALLLCQDETTGEYSPDACDLILPIDPRQQAHECGAEDFVKWLAKAPGADPVCSAYWTREALADRKRDLQHGREI